ncbi:IlvD/Edd family dehydratase [Fodinicurvata sp. EGI_FJ10296]|uniref:IlvD/Edd family dehydratase n=1 Tax=Fodinicurvata sp. EGI_FJ10296 TaxID=3231908 RepID=UPI00345402CE
MSRSDRKDKRRSQAWFGGLDKDGFIHRSWMRNQGIPSHAFDGRPIIGICNTYSELTPCNAHFGDLVAAVKRGVIEAGGWPLEFPVFSCGESNLRPTAMLFRNLASMDVEESIRGNPIDGVVLMMGCDKTTPSLIMGAASCDLPTIGLSGGPMLNGHHEGRVIGSGTDVWRLSEEVRAGVISVDDFMAAEAAMSRSAGHCMTMGTASTMASIVEALGLGLPYNAAYPAVDARRKVLAHMVGRRAVEIVESDLQLSRVLTMDAFRNAVRVNAAIGGSTNAVVHLIAIAGRLGLPFGLDQWDEWGRDVPTLVDLMPSGRYLMEDFCYAGGVPAVARRLAENGMLDGDALTVNGRTMGENVADAPVHNDDVIRPWDRPLTENGGIAVLRGNLAPRGAVLKPSAASPDLLVHEGPALVFESIEDLKARIDDPDLPVTPDTVLVLRNCGPKGYPGMAEVGNMPIPRKLVEQGVRDMVRISDARMSGTAYGTVVLHAAPESAAGGPLAVVRTGDRIRMDVPARRLDLLIDDDALRARMADWTAPAPVTVGGYQGLYVERVLQADQGADLDFLVGCRGAAVPRESH